MAYTTLVAGTTITASWANANVRDQGVTPFASAAARTSAISVPVEGMVTHLNDTNCLGVYTGAAWSTIGPVHGAWTAYTPALTNITIGNGSVRGSHQRIGRTVHFKVRIGFGSTTTMGTPPRFTLPFASSANTEDLESGLAVTLWDSSTSIRRGGFTQAFDTTNMTIGETSTGVAVTSTSPFTWATDDAVAVSGSYEAAADA